MKNWSIKRALTGLLSDSTAAAFASRSGIARKIGGKKG
jgi:hypothetical protein